MTRAPVVVFPSVGEVVKCIAWIESSEGFQILREAFNATSSHADLISIFPNPVSDPTFGIFSLMPLYLFHFF